MKNTDQTYTLGYLTKITRTSSPAPSDGIRLSTAHVEPLPDSLESVRTNPNSAFVSSSPVRCTDGFTHMGCYVIRRKDCSIQPTLFDQTGRKSTAGQSSNRRNRKRTLPATVPSTARKNLSATAGSFSEHTVEPEGRGEWYDFGPDGIAVPL